MRNDEQMPQSHRVVGDNYNKIRDYVRRIFTYKTGRRDDDAIDDITQDVCVGLLAGGMERFRRECSLSRYLNDMSNFGVLNYLNGRKGIRVGMLGDISGMEDFLEAPGGYPGSDGDLERAEAAEAFDLVQTVGESLPDTLGCVFRLMVLENRNHRETAKAIGRAISVVAERKRTVLRIVCNAVKEKYPDLVRSIQWKGCEAA